MKINERLWEKIDRNFIEIQGNIDLDNYLSPVNRVEELERFKEAVETGREYNPVFTYDPLPDVRETDLQKLLEELDAADPVQRIYMDAIRIRQGEIQAVKTHDGKTISEKTISAYGRPDSNLLDMARNNLNSLKPDQNAYTGVLPGKVYDAEALAEACRSAMSHYGFNWNVVVKPEMGGKAAVDNLIREFWIRSDVMFHESLLKMIIVHEIGTHILRSENGYAQPLELFGRGLPAYQFTEEGLAEYSEERSGVLHDDTVYRISGRAIAVQAALNGSFYQVYREIKDYFDTDMAFDIVQRVKLGIADTSQPGAFTKDYTYLAGLLKVRTFMSDAKKNEIDALFSGKVGFQHLDVVMALQKEKYLGPPKVYPEWLTLSS